MDIRDPHALAAVLQRQGTDTGHRIDCFGTEHDPGDFVYFTVYPDRLAIELHRVMVDVGSFYFLFTLQAREGAVHITRRLTEVQGRNRTIRHVLGEPYAKSSIGIDHDTLTEDEEAWVAEALRALHKGWMKD